MMNRYLPVLIFGWICVFPEKLFSQDVNDLMIQQKLEEYSSTDTKGTDLTELAGVLEELKEHPLSVNDTNVDDLKSLPFLTDKQIRNLVEYRRNYGELLSVWELAAIDGFDSVTIRRIEPFLSADASGIRHPVNLYNLITKGKNQLLFLYQQTLQKEQGYKAGDSLLAAKPSSGYLGSPGRLRFRYRYDFSDRVSLGITGEKDPGEEFFKGTQPNGMDFYGGYFALRNTGILKTLVIGDFSAGFGQGLTLGSGASFGSLLSSGSNVRIDRGINSTLTSDENRYLRGIAATLKKGRLAFSAFFSDHKRDANVLTLNSGETWVSSLGSSGYHRTLAELADKKTLQEIIMGGNLSFRNRYLKVGITAFHSQWNHPILKTAYPYNRFAFSGKQNLNAGADLLLVLKDHLLFGEASCSRNGGMAFLAGMTWSPGTRFSFTITWRKYSRNYQDLLSNAIGQGSDNSNETGLLLNFILRPLKKLILSGYIDQYAAPWLKYRKNLPTRGTECYLQADFPMNSRFRLVSLFSSRTGQINTSTGETVTKWMNTRGNTFRIDMEWHVIPQLMLKNRLEMVSTRTESGGSNTGYYLSQDVGYHGLKNRLSVSFRYAVFDTHSYDERVYAYESDFTGSFSVPAMEGRGIRCFLLAEWSFLHRFKAGVRYALTRYSDRNVIGTGLNAISGNTESEIKIQVEARF